MNRTFAHAFKRNCVDLESFLACQQRNHDDNQKGFDSVDEKAHYDVMKLQSTQFD